MTKALQFPLASLVCLFVAGCTQLAGLNDYDTSDEAATTDTDRPPITVHIQSSGTDPDAADDAGPDAGEAGVDAATSGPSVSSQDAAQSEMDSAQVVVTIMADEAGAAADSGAAADVGPVCAAPNQMCGEKCVAPDDPRHCGSCGHDCTANVSGAVSCSDGQCVVPESAALLGQQPGLSDAAHAPAGSGANGVLQPSILSADISAALDRAKQ
jgi:hypothetical protein